MTAFTDEVINLYREFSKIPTLSSLVGRAKIVKTNSEDLLTIDSVWLQRDIERSTKTKFRQTSFVSLKDDCCKVLSNSLPTDCSSELLSSISPSGQKRAVLRIVKDDNKDKQFLEVWSDDRKVINIDVKEQDLHEAINYEDEFGCFEWSEDESKLLYVAEAKRCKSESFFKKKDDKESTDRGQEYIYREDWGEQLSGICSPVPCILDVNATAIEVIDYLPKNVSFRQCIWGRNNDIVCVGLFHGSQKLGLKYCRNRRSAIFRVNTSKKQYEIIGSQDNAVLFPKISPNKSKLIYFENKSLGPHVQCSKLKMYDWTNVSTVIDQVQIPGDDSFPGLFPCSYYFLNENVILISTYWHNSREIVAVDLTSNEVKKVTDGLDGGSWNLLDVKDGVILTTASSFDTPYHIVVGRVTDGMNMKVGWSPLHRKKIPDVQYEFSKITPNSGDASLKFGAILVEPTNKDEESLPLIVFPHGGPHVLHCSDFSLQILMFVKLNFRVLLVNYRGSCGQGQASIDSLPGKIGDQDIKDVQQAVHKIIETKCVNAKKLILYGGSHGGFIVTHLIGQYPDMYSACVARNPVTDLSFLVDISDIPEWSWVEAGIGDDVTERSMVMPSISETMWNKSPMQYIDNVKTPTLFLLGSEDARVPYEQALKFYRALQARNIKSKLLLYKDSHPLSKVEVEADSLVNAILWFHQIDQ